MKTVIPLWEDPELAKIFPPAEFLHRNDLRGIPPAELLKKLRAIKSSELILWAYDLKIHRNLSLWKAASFFASAPKRAVWDSLGQKVSFNRLKVFFLLLGLALKALTLPYRLLFFKLKLRALEQELKKKKTTLQLKGKLCYLRTDYWFGLKAGGSVGHIAGVIKGFWQNGFKVRVISNDRLAGVSPREVDFTLISPEGGYTSFKEIPELLYNLKLEKEGEQLFKPPLPDFFYQRYSLNNYSGLFWALKLGLPLVLEYNGSFLWMEKHWGEGLSYPGLCARIELMNLKYADLVVVVSQVMKEELLKRGIPEAKILVNPNGVELEKFDLTAEKQAKIQALREKPGLGGKILAGFIGTFAPWHGIEVLARSIKGVVAKNPSLHFLLIGNGILMNKVKEIIKQDQVEDFVTLTGTLPQEDAPLYLLACDLLLSPHVPNPDGSRFFGSPTKLFEYLAAGKAIVASALEQIAAILEDEKTALLVTPGNQAQLEQAILRLAADPLLRERLGKAARIEAEQKYSWQENVKRVLRALRGQFNAD